MNDCDSEGSEQSAGGVMCLRGAPTVIKLRRSRETCNVARTNMSAEGTNIL